MKKKLPKKSTLKRKCDQLFSQIVRMRGECEWCHAKNDTLQCAHVFSRKFTNTRYAQFGAMCLCASCHFKAHAEPIEFTEWVKEYLGEETYQELRRKHNEIGKLDYASLYEELQSKLETAKQVYR
jgi:hypothetical protein